MPRSPVPASAGASPAPAVRITTRTPRTSASVKNIDATRPTAITLASGDHKLEPGEDHGRDAHRRRHRRQEDRTQPALRRLRCGLFGSSALRAPRVDVVHQDDGVPHHDPAQAHDPHERREAEWIVLSAAVPAPRRAKPAGWRPSRSAVLASRAELKQQDQEDRRHPDQRRVEHLTETFPSASRPRRRTRCGTRRAAPARRSVGRAAASTSEAR